MISRLAIMMGGRVAEEFKFGKENITSGASSDIEQATKLARAMVTRWGFSDKLGHVAYGDNQEEVFLGHSVARTQNVSEETAQIIDAEVRRLIDEAYSTAKTILTKKKKEWYRAGRRAARIRDAVGRRDQAADRRQEAVARPWRRHAAEPRLGRAEGRRHRRQAQEGRRARRRPGAAAAGLRMSGRRSRDQGCAGFRNHKAPPGESSAAFSFVDRHVRAAQPDAFRWLPSGSPASLAGC